VKGVEPSQSLRGFDGIPDETRKAQLVKNQRSIDELDTNKPSAAGRVDLF
jgi:hypothetical protein